MGQDASDAGKSGKLLFLPAGASQTEESHAKNARGHQTGLSLFSRARQKICRELNLKCGFIGHYFQRTTILMCVCLDVDGFLTFLASFCSVLDPDPDSGGQK